MPDKQQIVLTDEQIAKVAHAAEINYSLRVYLARFDIDIGALCATVTHLRAANKALAQDVVRTTNDAHAMRDRLESRCEQLRAENERLNAIVTAYENQDEEALREAENL